MSTPTTVPSRYRLSAATLAAAIMLLLAGCAGSSALQENAALGSPAGNGSNLGIAGSSASGVQLYGTVDLSVGRRETSRNGSIQTTDGLSSH